VHGETKVLLIALHCHTLAVSGKLWCHPKFNFRVHKIIKHFYTNLDYMRFKPSMMNYSVIRIILWFGMLIISLSCQPTAKQEKTIITDESEVFIETEKGIIKDTINNKSDNITSQRDFTTTHIPLQDQISKFISSQEIKLQLEKGKDNQLTLEQGTIIEIPRTAIFGFNEPWISVLEVYDASDIIFNSLSTSTIDGKVLETEGMLKIEFYDGKDIRNPNDAYSVLFPKSSNELNSLLFKGIPNKSSIKWDIDTTAKYDFITTFCVHIQGFLIEISESDFFNYVDTTNESNIYSDAKYLDDRIAITYDEKLQIFKDLKGGDNGAEIYKKGFKIEVKNMEFGRYVKVYPSEYPLALHNRVEKILKEANTNENSLAIDKSEFFINVYERRYYDSIQQETEERQRNQSATFEMTSSTRTTKSAYFQENIVKMNKYSRFFTKTNGWLNCDAFLNAKFLKTVTLESQELSDNAIVFIKLDNYKSFVKVEKFDSKYSSIEIPEKEKVTWIIIDELEGNILYDLIPTDKETKLIEEVNLKSTTLYKLKSTFSKL
jgi:hypothetical protein